MTEEEDAGLGITATGKLRFHSQQLLQGKAGALGVPAAPRPAQYRRLSIALSDVSVILSQSFFCPKKQTAAQQAPPATDDAEGGPDEGAFQNLGVDQ